MTDVSCLILRRMIGVVGVLRLSEISEALAASPLDYCGGKDAVPVGLNTGDHAKFFSDQNGWRSRCSIHFRLGGFVDRASPARYIFAASSLAFLEFKENLDTGGQSEKSE